MAASCINTQNWKQTKYSSTGGCLSKSQYFNTMESHSSIKRSKLQLTISLKCIMLSERSLTQRAMYFDSIDSEKS